MAGLTPQGFETKRLTDIIAELQEEARIIFQDLVPAGDVVNTDPNSIIGRQIGLVSTSLTDLWELAEQVDNSFNINAATGVALDNLCALGGVQRNPATGTITPVKLGGLVNTAIPAGSRVSSTNNNEFHTTSEVVVLDRNAVVKAQFDVLTVSNTTAYTITYTRNPDTNGDGPTSVTYTSDSSATIPEILNGLAALINGAPHNTVLTATVVGAALIVETLSYTNKVNFTTTANLNIPRVEKVVNVVCETTGPIDQPINTITKISVPILGWETVTNPAAGIPGSDRETDGELRLRYDTAKFGDGSNLIESLHSALYALEDVVSVVIVSNDTDSTIVTPTTIPPHSFYIAVLGGDTQLIGNAIWANKPAGILSYGTSETVTVTDSQGIGHDVSFDRPTPTSIYVSIDITVQPDFAPDGVDAIKQAVADYINSLLIGEDVIYSRLYSPINSVRGHYVNTLKIGTSPSPSGTSNIAIAFNQKAVASVDDIVISTS